ncbi:MAG: hypothetical protein MRQ05_06070 [Candidatus Midichloria mitochondrii]|nr:hypothetical protein [Candidatus Midichloria mitochondrii]
MTNPAHHGTARQTISWQTSSRGSWLMSSTQYISLEKTGSWAYSLRQTEVTYLIILGRCPFLF